MRPSSFAFLLLAWSLPLWATGLGRKYAGHSEMNGIKFADYKEFLQRWSLVTIRFRKDTGEMRLTYANKLALDTLVKGEIKYPDGAVFAKTGILTGVDTQFTSSIVPLAVRRYQLMVKNKTKYASTGGWGYALFDSAGKTFPEDPIKSQDACYACHAIVENRGDVFSEPFNFTSEAKFIRPIEAQGEPPVFFDRPTASLPKKIQASIPATFKKIRELVNKKLQANVFQGTLDELKPLLEAEALTSQSPALFLAQDQKRFVLVTPLKMEECLNGIGAEFRMTTMDDQVSTQKLCLHD